jgi:Uma2 family endonuclease
MFAVVDPAHFRMPAWVSDLASFRRWAASEDFPEKGKISYLRGDIWVDMTLETVLHNKVKFAVAYALQSLIVGEQSGHLLIDGMRLTHPEADLSTEPDGMFLSHEAIDRQRVQLVKGDATAEVVGSPDMVLEVVSPSSVEKDTVVLPGLYWTAGVQEYWLIDPRGKELRFDLMRRGANKFVAARKQAGWAKSAIFGKSFRLTRAETKAGLTEVALDVR